MASEIIEVNGQKIEITVRVDGNDLYRAIEHAIDRYLAEKATQEQPKCDIEIVNNIIMDGDTKPDELVEKLTRKMKIDLRTI